MVKNIKILKLITGQDLMAEVLPSVVGVVKIKNAIMMTPIKEFVTQYNSLFGGIVMPAGSNLIIP
jgi:hypothetical protein